MRNRFSVIIRLTLCLLVFVGSAFAASDKERTALYNDLIKYGTADQIRKQLVEDEKFSKSLDGVTADNLLMQAIALNREPEIIQMLLESDIYTLATNAERQTAVMYACAYLSDAKSILMVIKRDSLSKNSVRQKLLRTDNSGLAAVDYAYKLHNTVAIETIRPYLSEDLLAAYGAKYKSPAIAQVQEPQEDIAAQDEKIVEPLEEQSTLEPAPIATPETPASVKPETTYLFDGIAPTEQNQAEPAQKSDLTYISDASKADSRGRTRLMQAVVEGDMPLVSNLLFSGAAIDDTDDDGWTALMYAARYQNDSRITQSLIAAGADTTLKNKYGLSALTLAATYSQSENVISLLLNEHKTANEDVIQSFIYSLTTPSGKPVPFQIRVTELFLNKGIDVNVYWKGKTPLMYAAKNTQTTDVLAMLLAKGARKDVSSNDGHNAFYYAEQNANLPRNEVFWSLNSKN